MSIESTERVAVQWRSVDTFDGKGWASKDDFYDWAGEKIRPTESIGYLAIDEPEYIVVAMSYNDGVFTDCIKIPRDNIIQLFEIGRIK